MSNLSKLLQKTTAALGNAAAWAKHNKLGEKMLVTSGVIASLGVVYMMGTAAHGMSVETGIMKQAGMQAYDTFKTAEAFGLKAIVGDFSHLRSLADLPGPLIEAIKAPFSNNMAVESFRGLGASAGGVIGIAMGLVTKFVTRNAEHGVVEPEPIIPATKQPETRQGDISDVPLRATILAHNRIDLAVHAIPQVAAALRAKADVTVLDRMLRATQNNIELCELLDEPIPSLEESFAQMERMHGGFRDFYQTTLQTVRWEAVQRDLSRIEAIVADVDAAAAIHFMPNLRTLYAAEPLVASRFEDLITAVDSLRANAAQCKLAPAMAAEIARIEDSAYLHTAETMRYASKSPTTLKFG